MLTPFTVPRVRGRARAGAALAAVLALTIALAGCTASEPDPVNTPVADATPLPDDTAAQLQAAVQAALGTTGASGAVVGVWVPWSGEWVSGVGVVSTGATEPVTTDMSFRAGRITREMTCDALAGMVADRIVQYEDDVATYVPGIRTERVITLAQLCDSTSGIQPISDTVHEEFITNPARVWTPRELASFGFGRPTTSAPGEKYVDSDAGYLLLGIALERASGLTAAEYLAKYVTEPLGLSNTVLPAVAAATPTPAPYLVGQLPQPGEDAVLKCDEPLDVSVLSSSAGFTDSGVTTTIRDLGAYASALATGKLARDGQPDRFADPVPTADDAPSWLNTAGGSIIAGSLVGQSGMVPGYATAAYADPSTGMTVAVVLNSSAGDGTAARDLAWQLAAIASKAPAAAGNTAPEFGLPWTAEEFGQAIAAAAVCPAAPTE